MVVIRVLEFFDFDFDLLKDLDQNLKYEIKFIIKSNESLAENKIKTKLDNY